MNQYLDLLNHILINGNSRSDRTGIGTRSVFGYQMRFDLSDSFPLLTTKRVHTKAIVHELLWFLKGDTNIKYLRDNNVTIWDEWADKDGELGPVYGKQWRSWEGVTRSRKRLADMAKRSVGVTDRQIVRNINYEAAVHDTVDQIAQVIHTLRTNPDSRRIIVNAWNPADIDLCALPPCHCLFQFYTRAGAPSGKLYLDCQLYQRSGDVFLGVPFNIASYSLLTCMIAQVVGMVPGHFIMTLGDAHLYSNHMEQVRLQLSRTPSEMKPQLKLSPNIRELEQFAFSDITFENYYPQAAIPAAVAV